MLFLKKLIAIRAHQDFDTPSMNKTPIDDILRRVIEKIETQYINDQEEHPVKTFADLLKKATSYPFFQSTKHAKELEKMKSYKLACPNLVERVSHPDLTRLSKEEEERVVCFLTALCSLVLQDTAMQEENKKQFFQSMVNQHDKRNPLGVAGLTHLLWLKNENEETEQNLTKFENYFLDHKKPPFILGFFGSHEICPIQVEGLEVFSGFILKQDSNIVDTQSNSSGYVLYIFDKELKRYIEKSIKKTIAEPTPSLPNQEHVFDLMQLTELCHTPHKDESEKSRIEFKVSADWIGTPRGALPSENQKPIIVSCTKKEASNLKNNTPVCEQLKQIIMDKNQESVKKKLFQGDLPEEKSTPQSNAESDSESDEDTTASSHSSISLIPTPDLITEKRKSAVGVAATSPPSAEGLFASSVQKRQDQESVGVDYEKMKRVGSCVDDTSSMPKKQSQEGRGSIKDSDAFLKFAGRQSSPPMENNLKKPGPGIKNCF